MCTRVMRCQVLTVLTRHADLDFTSVTSPASYSDSKSRAQRSDPSRQHHQRHISSKHPTAPHQHCCCAHFSPVRLPSNTGSALAGLSTRLETLGTDPLTISHPRRQHHQHLRQDEPSIAGALRGRSQQRGRGEGHKERIVSHKHHC